MNMRELVKKIRRIVEKDKVNKPAHYQGNSLQAIDVIEDFELGFSLGNAIKYILRAGKKEYEEGEDEVLDLLKAKWYIDREIAKRSS